MKTLNYILLGSVAVLTSTINTVQANDLNTTPHYTVSNEAYLGFLTPEQHVQLINYLEYEEREPCQNYRTPPINFYRDGCEILYKYAGEEISTNSEEVKDTDISKNEVLANYVIYFDFNKSEIDSSDVPLLNKIFKDILIYNPSKLTVAGHTDRSGSISYNVNLSERRANSISQALTDRGISHMIIDQEKYGETGLAVETEDGVRLRENRRVVIDFIK